jgi:hypothetical protein
LLDDLLERQRGERRERQRGERRERQRGERRERQRGQRRERQRGERRERQRGERRERQRGERRWRERNLEAVWVVVLERKLFGKHRCRSCHKDTFERQLGRSYRNRISSYIGCKKMHLTRDWSQSLEKLQHL